MSFDAETSSHRAAQRGHAMRQCRARYGTQLTVGGYLQLCDLVWAELYGVGLEGDVYLAGSAGRNRVFVRFGRRYLLTAWSEVTMQIATFLPLSCDLGERSSN